MEVPAGQDGIQRLLAAEQEAQAIVQRARQGAKLTANLVSGSCQLHCWSWLGGLQGQWVQRGHLEAV